MDKRIGVYLRVSTKGQSTELQRTEIEAFLRHRGWNSWLVYEDVFTGTSAVRPQLYRMMEAVRSRHLDIIVIWKLDRLFRSLKDLISTLKEFQELGVQLISIKDQVDMTTSSGRLLLHIIGSFAEFERDLIVSRVSAGLENAKRKGIKLGRPKTIPASEVHSLRQKGMSLEQIARRIGASKSGVHKTLSKPLVQPIEIVHPEKENLIGQNTKDLETPILPNKKVNYD